MVGQIKNAKRLHRLVVLPDYQGLGIGKNLIQFLGDYLYNLGCPFYVKTSSIAVNMICKRSSNFILLKQGRTIHSNTTIKTLNKTFSSSRITCSWKYVCK